MAENETENGAAAQPQQQQQAQQPKMNVLAQYVRDLSFENILSQKGTTGEVQPDIQVEVNLDAKKRQQDNQFEVALKLKITSKSKATSDVLFLLEMDYAGVFQIENVPEDQLHPYLLIECPRMIFPFARRIVSDVTRDGGFPPLNLETIDFVALYRNEIMRRQAAQQAQAKATPDA
ncbi:MAG: protein-export chaperone SecB [Marinovum algicola]|jgi:preprotein translocase subunit SecB|uniref:Protein-export protein SecB n=1 Tax=Marinovum algicola TaxID=42444 RepID=A0A975W9Z8_9RHOB|nr:MULTISPECIES: protein-export chaperone SecB [Marinovum]AKO98732.1 protein-export chaperone SecB [Marinovum algicola DG 898]MDD9738265.1 protein-export chaperone SecB [Marinovum sp. SP66]MDD9743157.1 protein-export chaperone SecB [Marinovum sp. PR37]SEJ47014.1 protein translocase subunit secB [Marinovum algicola]SLN35362.1 Protein-export protein SecB [Marinovum algicola]